MNHAVWQDPNGAWMCKCGRIFQTYREAARHVNAWEQQWPL